MEANDESGTPQTVDLYPTFTDCLQEVENDAKVERFLHSIQTNVIEQLKLTPYEVDDFDMGTVLGVGAFGTVRIAKLKKEKAQALLASSIPPGAELTFLTSTTVNIQELDIFDLNPTTELVSLIPKLCIKVIGKERLVQQKQLDHVQNEVTILRTLNHPFITPLYGIMQDRNAIYLLMECIEGGELFGLLLKHKYFPVHASKFYAAQVLLIFDYLHRQNIAYRDLKPENILINHRGDVVLTDFGITKHVEGRTYTLVGTPEYMSPEQVTTGVGHGLAVDWWGFGILLFEMLTGNAPFVDEGGLSIYEHIKYDPVQFPDDMTLYAKDLISRLLNKDWTCRYGCLVNGSSDVKAHKFFRGVNWNRILDMSYPTPWNPVLTRGEPSDKYFDSYRLSEIYTITEANEDVEECFSWLECW